MNEPLLMPVLIMHPTYIRRLLFEMHYDSIKVTNLVQSLNSDIFKTTSLKF